MSVAETVLSLINELVMSEYESDLTESDLDKTWKELDIDSLDRLEIHAGIKDELDVMIAPEKASEIKTIRDLIEATEAELA